MSAEIRRTDDEPNEQLRAALVRALADSAAGRVVDRGSFAQYADDEDGEEDPEGESRDDFMMLFVGPNPAAIMQEQRDLLVQDLVALMERHFDGSELSGVVAEVDKLFTQRFDALVSSLEIGKPRRGPGGSHGGTGHGGGRKPRHLH